VERAQALVLALVVAAQRVRVSLLIAGIIGAGRSRTVWIISVLSIPRRVDGRDPEIGVLDDEQRDTFTGHLHGVRVSKLMRRKSAWDPGLMGGVAQLRPDPGGRARPAACRSAEYEEDRADGEPGSNREPRL
jgi:hypothetical protein